jgi:hypothetical protein
MKRALLIVAAALSVAAGCAGPQSGPARAPAYGDGYKDGCQSGEASISNFGRYTKNVARFESDPQYAKGWSDGFAKCEEEQFRRNTAGR